jgi:hypothetical protein
MALQIADQYYLKAKSAMSGFCSDWGEVCESLNYAISHDETHCPSLILLGKIYTEYLYDFEEGFSYFDAVIVANTNYTAVYPTYIKALIWNEDLEQAQKLIDFSLTIKAIDKASIFWLQAYVLEVKKDYKKGIKFLKEAKKETFNDHFSDYLDEEKKRLKAKLEELKPKKKMSKKKKKKSKKKAKKSKK